MQFHEYETIIIIRPDIDDATSNAIVERCDVTSVDSLTALADAAQDKLGGLDLVFANAGIGAGEPPRSQRRAAQITSISTRTPRPTRVNIPSHATESP